MNDDLIRLRAQIDQIDQQLLDLLDRRLATAEQVAAAKSSQTSIFRPERETVLLARLCKAADSRLQPVICAVWRAIISAAIARQKPDFTIAMTSASQQTARLFAAGQLAVQLAASPVDLCRQLAAGKADIGIIEADELAELHIHLGLDRSVKIIAGLPFVCRQSSVPSAFVVACRLPDASDYDRFVMYDNAFHKIKLMTAEERKLSSDLSVLGICALIS